MKYFIAFQKSKALVIIAADKSANNQSLAHQFNHELMKYGYVLNKAAFDMLATLTAEEINVIYNDLFSGIKNHVGGGGYEPTYRNFPQSVLALSYEEFILNAVQFYWSGGRWRPEDAAHLKREFNLEPINYKPIGVITEEKFTSLFTDLLYSGASISGFDKQVVDWFIDNGYKFALNKITFKETLSYVGKRLMDNKNILNLPTSDATNVLRIWAAYSGGDEGLKTNTKFKKPNAHQKIIMRNTLERAYNLEESFKVHREPWLRILFWLNPMTKTNRKSFPNLYKFAYALRNEAKTLRTFASRVEELLNKKDILVLELLKTRPGVFMRRLDHTVRLFGISAINKWLEVNPKIDQLITAYNHFTSRDQKQEARGAVLASQSSSSVVTYDAQAPLPTALVINIREALMGRIRLVKNAELSCKKIFINRALYYRPLAVNNRASSMSLDGKVNGTVEQAPKGKTLRLYTTWEDASDIDLSGFLLTKDNAFIKVGWNAAYVGGEGAGVVYSGDNTGNYAKNAEYLDITPAKVDKRAEWIIVVANIYAHRHYGVKERYSFNSSRQITNDGFKAFKGKARAGWMAVAKPEANTQWQPDTIEHSMVLNSDANTSCMMAFHVETHNIVYLDLAFGDANVSNAEDAIKLKQYLKTFITLDKGDDEISWEKINQGHVLNILSQNVVDKAEDADIVFDENTTWESVAKYFNAPTEIEVED